jgi:hypothetical protein
LLLVGAQFGEECDDARVDARDHALVCN